MKTCYRICANKDFNCGIYRDTPDYINAEVSRLRLNRTSINRPHYSLDWLLRTSFQQKNTSIYGYLFCFSSIDSFFSWFKPKEILHLAPWGVVIFRFQVEDEFFVEGSSQCVFLKYKQVNVSDVSDEIFREAQKRLDNEKFCFSVY